MYEMMLEAALSGTATWCHQKQLNPSGILLPSPKTPRGALFVLGETVARKAALCVFALSPAEREGSGLHLRGEDSEMNDLQTIIAERARGPLRSSEGFYRI